MTPAPRGDASASVAVPARHDLRGTLGSLRHGAGDRSVRFLVDGTMWRATRTPDGPGTARYAPVPGAGAVRVDAWGPGAPWLVANAPSLLGVLDDTAGFEELARQHPLVARLHRHHPGLRVPRSLAVYEAALPAVCEQKVTGREARRSWWAIVDRWGEAAPGPRPPGRRPLRVPPAPHVLAAVPYEAFHPIGIERRRAETLRAVARHADRLEEAATMAPAAAHERLRAVNGVGPWTAAEVALVALGDADAVPVGDYHLPGHVCFALTGARGGDDALMVELLAPFAPHRGRVIRLLGASGVRPPRRGPRLAPEDHRRR